MKQKIVIKVTMSCERSRSKAMALAARTTGVISVRITGDGRDQLEVVGDGIDPVCLVSRLRKKVGQAQILKLEQVKNKKMEQVGYPVAQCYPGYYHHHHYPPHMVIHDEPSICSFM